MLASGVRAVKGSAGRQKGAYGIRTFLEVAMFSR
jgi:hypothetical protein